MKNEEIKKEIEKLEERIFYHEMKDHWTQQDFKLAKKLEQDLMILKEKLVKEGNDKNENNNK